MKLESIDISDLEIELEQTSMLNEKNTEVLKESQTEITSECSSVEIDSESENENYPVHIMGEVANPGVYYLKTGDIIDHLITKAGGLTDRADLRYVNLAAKTIPNQKVYIPSIDEEQMSYDDYLTLVQNEVISESEASQENNKININTADQNELQKLNGIGPSKANDIIGYRELNGSFQTIEEIMNVAGIKENIFEKIKNQITVK
ncbi:MAG: ComEA family DNA-binding protein [Clostridiaceae bacterium]|nr:ComEA family DNA-binding protein [Clostridiaceae bacterium]